MTSDNASDALGPNRFDSKIVTTTKCRLRGLREAPRLATFDGLAGVAAALEAAARDHFAMKDENCRGTELKPGQSDLAAVEVDSVPDGLDQLPDILLVLDAEGRILECRGGDAKDLTLPRDRLIGRRVDACTFGSVGTQFADAMQSARTEGNPVSIEYTLPGDEGLRHFEARIATCADGGFLAVIRSTTQRAHADVGGRGVRNMLSMLRAIFDATADGILALGPKGKFVTSNRLFGEMWSIPPELLRAGREKEILRRAVAQVEDPGTMLEQIRKIERSSQTRGSMVVKFLDGRFLECVSMSQTIEGRNHGRVWSFRDVTDRVRAEERIRHHAYHDSLTELPNRALFHDRLNRDLAHSRRAGTVTALLLLDLDRFKTINDTLGHAAGDTLLVEVARRLSSRRREGDTIARLGGDEFVVVITQLRRKEDAAIVADQILDALKPPIHIAEHDLHVSASIGIALFPEDGDEGASLMKSADVALYRAKELGRDNYQFYEPRLNQRAMERLVLERDLRRAIHDHEFVLQYQPQFDLKTGRMRGVEALIRWKQGEEIVPPGRFIPIAEECGLIVPLGRWVLEEAARQCAEFNRHSLDPLRVCVNVSALQMQRPDFANEVAQILLNEGLPLQQLVVELTESALMQNPEQGSWAMAQLQQMGIGIAMDDFGTGHSSLNHVSLLPISIIKIDRSFVINCSTRKADAMILAAIVTMGHALGLKVLAEGVETHEQARILREQGCDEVQGYLYGKPSSPEQLLALLQRQDGRHGKKS